MSRHPLGPAPETARKANIAGAVCWLSADGRWIVAARAEVGDRILRWRSEA